MRAEGLKWFTGALSTASVVAVGLTIVYLPEFDSEFAKLVTSAAIVATMFASITSIWVSRRLELKRASGRIFIVYAREDMEAAERIYDQLSNDGFRPWLDVVDILPGEIWSKTINLAIEESRAALVLVSRSLSGKEGFVHKEIHAAMTLLQDSNSGRHVVIPVRLDDVPVPAALKDIQWVDLFDEKGYEKLSRALKTITA